MTEGRRQWEYDQQGFYFIYVAPMFMNFWRNRSNVIFYYLWISHNVPITHSLSTPPRSTLPLLWPPSKTRKKKIPTLICIALILMEHGQTPNGQSLKENSPSPPLPLPQAINCGELHFSIPPTIFKSSFQWLLWGGVGWRREGGEESLSWKPSVSLTLSCESAVVDTSGKEASWEEFFLKHPPP